MAKYSYSLGVVRDAKIVTTTRVFGDASRISSNASQVHNVRVAWKDGGQSTLDLRGQYSIGDIVALIARNNTYVSEHNLTTNVRIDYNDKLTLIVRFTGPGCLPTLVAVGGAMLIPLSNQIKGYPDSPLAPFAQLMLIGGGALMVGGLLWYLSVHGGIRSAITRQITAARASAEGWQP